MADTRSKKAKRNKPKITKDKNRLELENERLKEENKKLSEEIAKHESIHKDTVGENIYLHELLNQARHRKYVTNSDEPKYEQLSIFNEAENS